MRFSRQHVDGVPSTVGQQTRRVGRWVLWSTTITAVVFVLANGVARIFSSPAQAAPAGQSASTPGLDAARGRAVAFAHALLTWSPATAERQTAALERMLAEDVDAAHAVRLIRTQRVLAAWPGAARVRGQAARIVVTCLIARDGETVTQDLAVPVAWTLRDGAVDGLVVYDYPQLVSPSAKAPTPADGGQSLDAGDSEAIASLLTRFFGAYLAGGDVAPEFLTPTAVIQPLGRRYTLVGVLSSDDLEQIGPGGNSRQIAATVRVRDDATRAVFTFRQRVWVQHTPATGRWLVESV